MQEGVTYVYQVRAKGDGLSNSDPSDTSSATVLPATPVSFTATVAGITKIDLSWTNASTVATEFSLDRRVLPGGPITPIVLPDPRSTTFSDSERTGLVDGTTYEYRVFATVDGVENSVGQPVKSLPAVQTATTPVPAVAFAAPPATLVNNQASAAGEGNCQVQLFRPGLLGGAGPQVSTQVRITVRGSSLGSLTLDSVFISRVAAPAIPMTRRPDLTLVATAVPVPASSSVALPPVNYALDPAQDLLVAFDISRHARPRQPALRRS